MSNYSRGGPSVALGTKFFKQFDAGVFEGVVKSYNHSIGFYRVEYDDGDAEDMHPTDLKRLVQRNGHHPTKSAARPAAQPKPRPSAPKPNPQPSRKLVEYDSLHWEPDPQLPSGWHMARAYPHKPSRSDRVWRSPDGVTYRARAAVLEMLGEAGGKLQDSPSQNEKVDDKPGPSIASAHQVDLSQWCTSSTNSGYVGVSARPNGRFEARIKHKALSHYLGLFDTKEAAATAVALKSQQLTNQKDCLPEYAELLWPNSRRLTHDPKTCAHCIKETREVVHDMMVGCKHCGERFRSWSKVMAHTGCPPEAAEPGEAAGKRKESPPPEELELMIEASDTPFQTRQKFAPITQASRLQLLAKLPGYPAVELQGATGWQWAQVLPEATGGAVRVQYADGTHEQVDLESEAEFKRFRPASISTGPRKRKKVVPSAVEEAWPDLEKALRASIVAAKPAPKPRDKSDKRPRSNSVDKKNSPKEATVQKLDCQSWPGLKKAMKLSVAWREGEQAPADARGLPKLWPDEVQYVAHQLYDAQLWKIAQTPGPPKQIMQNVQIRQLEAPHPAFSALEPAFGLFAKGPLQVGEVMGDYSGLVKRRVPEDKSHYLFSFISGGGVDLDIDAKEFGNETRFINDYHGITDTPNCRYELYDDTRQGVRAARVVVISEVLDGQELTCDYGGFFGFNGDPRAQETASKFFRCRPDDTPHSVAQLLNLDVKELVACNSSKFPGLKKSSRFQHGTSIVLPEQGELTPEEQHLRWVLQLSEGDRVDCKDKNGDWDTAVVVGFWRNNSIKIHFTGYRTEFDEMVAQDEIATRLAPRGTRCAEGQALVVDSQDKLEAAEVLCSRGGAGEPEEYLVHWDGYTKEDATWEPIQSLRDEQGVVCPALIRFFSLPRA